MISVQVRYFASLREQKGCASEQVQIAPGSTARQLGQRLQLQLDDASCMVAVNRTQADPDYIVEDGDEVAFFPPVTGG